jgi:hypothetical protein
VIAVWMPVTVYHVFCDVAIETFITELSSVIRTLRRRQRDQHRARRTCRLFWRS